jgi:hypothetical protein
MHLVSHEARGIVFWMEGSKAKKWDGTGGWMIE